VGCHAFGIHSLTLCDTKLEFLHRSEKLGTEQKYCTSVYVVFAKDLLTSLLVDFADTTTCLH